MTTLNLYKYTKVELESLLKSIVILVDTREQEKKHITDYFDIKGISYKGMALKYGDYSFYLPRNEELGISRDLYFNDEIVIERKGSLEELSGNLAQDRQRFEDEFLRAKARIILMIEAGSYGQILNHDYRTQFSEKAFLASLFTFKYRYGVDIEFLWKQHAGQYIFNTFYYYLREKLNK